VVVAAAGAAHTVAVTKDGRMYAWGKAAYGRLGLGKHVRDDQHAPMRMGGEEDHDSFGGSRVLWAACGSKHTLAVTADGAVWTWGHGAGGRLGLNDRNKRFVPTRVPSRCFMLDPVQPHGKVLWAGGGDGYSASLSHEGTLWTWGQAAVQVGSTDAPSGLGHGDFEDKLVPARLHGLKVALVFGVFRQEQVLAFAMATHARLGANSECSCLTNDMVLRIAEAGGGVLGA